MIKNPGDMTLDEIIEVCEQFTEIQKNTQYGYGYNSFEILETARRLKAFGLKWGEMLTCPDFRITKGNYYLTNSATKFKPDPDTYYVHWDNGNIGQLQFVNSHIFYDGWEEFLNKLMSYNPLDYDPYNCHIVYDVENGKKVMADYKDICEETKQKAKEASIQHRMKELEEEMKKLKEM